jgi:hypothetical protein
MTFIEAQNAADKWNKGYKAELLPSHAPCGQIIGGKYFPKRKIMEILGKPTGRPGNALPRRWVATLVIN